MNSDVSLLEDDVDTGTEDTTPSNPNCPCPSIPSPVDTIRYGLVVLGQNFYTLIAPTPIEAIQLENLRTKSQSIGNSIKVDNLHFMRIVSALSSSAVPSETSNCKELINEVDSVFLNNSNLVASCNARIRDVFISGKRLSWYACIDTRIVDCSIPLDMFLSTYHSCIDSPVLTEVNGVTASNTLWTRILQVYPQNKPHPKLIVNPYSSTYSLFTIHRERIVYTRYARYRHPIFDDYIERKVIKADDITKAVYSTSSSSLPKIPGASLGC